MVGEVRRPLLIAGVVIFLPGFQGSSSSENHELPCQPLLTGSQLQVVHPAGNWRAIAVARVPSEGMIARRECLTSRPPHRPSGHVINRRADLTGT